MNNHGGQGKGIKRVHGQYRFCGRCGQKYDGVTPHGPAWCTPRDESAAAHKGQKNA
jgi:NADH pyrophosphatase NudC (nudix superfamily)